MVSCFAVFHVSFRSPSRFRFYLCIFSFHVALYISFHTVSFHGFGPEGAPTMGPQIFQGPRPPGSQKNPRAHKAPQRGFTGHHGPPFYIFLYFYTYKPQIMIIKYVGYFDLLNFLQHFLLLVPPWRMGLQIDMFGTQGALPRRATCQTT